VKAYRVNDFIGVTGLTRVEEPLPRPQRGEVLVKVHAVSLNFRDIAMMRNEYSVPHKHGLIPTSDAAGVVMEIGEGVDRFIQGDRVLGVFQEVSRNSAYGISPPNEARNQTAPWPAQSPPDA
jgi:alcohol dehydrogenase